jgi:hypothetical protein
LHPASARLRAIASPIPDVDPVTMADLPFSTRKLLFVSRWFVVVPAPEFLELLHQLA